MTAPFFESGIASIYDGGKTASGIVAKPNDYVAAHRTLPFGTCVRVTHGHLSVTVTIVDRGPFVSGRIIDLMPTPANAIGITEQMGIAPVTIETVER